MKIELCKNTSDLLCVLIIAAAIVLCCSSISGCAKVYNETERDVGVARYKAGVFKPSHGEAK